MKTIVTAWLFFATVLTAQGQTEQQLVTEAVRLEAAAQEPAAIEKLGAVLRSNPNHYFALWKSSELYSRIGIAQGTKSKQLAYYNKARQLAAQAIKAQANDAEGYYVMSVAMGRLALASPSKEKIAAVKSIKEYAEKALRYNPNHGRAWHVLGKWHAEVSDLNMVERAAVKVFFGGFQPASLADAIRAFEKAHSLEPNFALNHLELAKAYARNDQDAKAKAMLVRLQSLPNKTGDDNRVKAEGRALLKDLD